MDSHFIECLSKINLEAEEWYEMFGKLSADLFEKVYVNTYLCNNFVYLYISFIIYYIDTK